MRARIREVVLTVIFVSLLFQPSYGREPSSEADKPNLVFVFSDQHAWDMLGCNGNPDIITPNFDRLAAQGVRFTHAISNSPVCTPYRGILLTGQHPLYCGAMQNDLQVLPGSGSIPPCFQAAAPAVRAGNELSMRIPIWSRSSLSTIPG